MSKYLGAFLMGANAVLFSFLLVMGPYPRIKRISFARGRCAAYAGTFLVDEHHDTHCFVSGKEIPHVKQEL